MGDSARISRTYPSVKDWSHRRVVSVELDGDLVVDFRLPDLGVWIAQGKIPNPLRSMAETIEYGLVQPEALNDDDRQAYYDLQAFIIATHLVKPDLVQDLGGEQEAVEWVKEQMPPTHRDLIWLRAFHIVPGDMIASLGDLLTFREEPSGGGAAGDSPQGRSAAE